MKRYVISMLLCVAVCSANPSTSKIKKDTTGAWTLYYNSEVYTLKGSTMALEYTAKTIGTYLRDLKFLGVNSIRTWGTGDETQLLLDSCSAYGITVTMGLWLRHGKDGMEGEDNFNYVKDVKGKAEQLTSVVNQVKRYKNHPALIMWGLGNEVVLNIATEPEKIAYGMFLETVAQAIKKEDPNHLILSASAWSLSWPYWRDYAPSIDVYGINTYGAGASAAPGELTRLKIDKPYLITEFGAQGEWEVGSDHNGLKIEPKDRDKYRVLAYGYEDWISWQKTCVGVYMFNYSIDLNHTANWLGYYLDGHYRPQYWGVRKAYTGKDPVNYVPEIIHFSLPHDTVKPGDWVPVTTRVRDKEKEALTISFHYNSRFGHRLDKSKIHSLKHRGSLEKGYEIQIPEVKDVIKVYIHVLDSYNNLGVAQTSLKVAGQYTE